MKRSAILAALLLVGASLPASSADPAWWTTRGVKNSASASNRAAATIGQAKHVVAMALQELQARLPAADYNALAADVALIVDLAPPTTQAGFDKQRAALVNGQLKALAKPFYDRLRALDAVWVDSQMSQSGIRVADTVSPLVYSPYPWTTATSDDKNLSLVTVGQLKAVFSLRFEVWGESEPGDPPPTGPVDSDSDGLSDVTEIAIGTSPTLTDTDGDGHSDATDFFPLDPSRWAAPTGTSGDLTPPTIVLISPPTATYVAGP